MKVIQIKKNDQIWRKERPPQKLAFEQKLKQTSSNLDSSPNKNLSSKKKEENLAYCCLNKLVRRLNSSTAGSATVVEERMRYVVPFVLLVLYQLLCSVTFYTLQVYIITTDGNNNTDSMVWNRSDDAAGRNVSKSVENCADRDNASFGKAFYFTSTVFFSIGYGDVVPCMWYGKCLTIIFASTGVPLTLFCLSRLGRPMKSLMEHGWYRCLSVFCKRKRNIADEEDNEWALPLPVGIALTFGWIFVSSCFFKLTIVNLREKGGNKIDPVPITYLDAVYFTVISLFTIGFGDFAPNNRSLDWITFTFIFIGLAMVSMCVAIAQRNMEQKFDNLKVLSTMLTLFRAASPSPTFPLASSSSGDGLEFNDLTLEQSKILQKIIFGALAQSAIIERWRSSVVTHSSKVATIQCELILAPPLEKLHRNSFIHSSTTMQESHQGEEEAEGDIEDCDDGLETITTGYGSATSGEDESLNSPIPPIHDNTIGGGSEASSGYPIYHLIESVCGTQMVGNGTLDPSDNPLDTLNRMVQTPKSSKYVSNYHDRGRRVSPPEQQNISLSTVNTIP